jgi:para-nitrobenzyl esterase
MPQDAESQKLAAMMQDYLANFIKTGNPNGANLPRWPDYRGAHRAPLLIDRVTEAVPDFRAAQLGYWHRLWAERTGQSLP